MNIIRAPFRISFFGGSTDYRDFYEKHESFVIGTTIDKYVYCSIRNGQQIGEKKSMISYSKIEKFSDISEIENSLIRETLKYHNLDKNIEAHFFSDIPTRTGLGGSSSFCVALSYALRSFLNREIDKKIIANDAIKIERYILNESGGIQDQIHSAYGGFNSIQIDKFGNFKVKPVPVSMEFIKEFEESLVLIYTNSQRVTNDIAKSHENKDKIAILDIAKEAYDSFIKEDIQSICKLLNKSWEEKKAIANSISNTDIDNLMQSLKYDGVSAMKLLGTGGCGFVLCICTPDIKNKLINKYKGSVLDIKFEKYGATEIYKI